MRKFVCWSKACLGWACLAVASNAMGVLRLNPMDLQEKFSTGDFDYRENERNDRKFSEFMKIKNQFKTNRIVYINGYSSSEAHWNNINELEIFKESPNFEKEETDTFLFLYNTVKDDRADNVIQIYAHEGCLEMGCSVRWMVVDDVLIKGDRIVIDFNKPDGTRLERDRKAAQDLLRGE